MRGDAEGTARETLDAIRLAVEGASDDARAVAVIRAILSDGPAPIPTGTASTRRLLRAIKRVKRASHWSRVETGQ